MQTRGLNQEELRREGARGVKGLRALDSLRELAADLPLSLALILLVCLLIYGRTLSSFFLADDIGEIRYVHLISQGRWDLFWSNFCGNYMQVPSMAVYRPVLLLLLMFDYVFWKANPTGYYLSNLIYFIASAALLFVFIRQLCASWGKLRANLCALFSALIFAASPLHCESVSWVVGRVDSACCMFYLASLVIFMSTRRSGAKRSRLTCALGILAFVLAICTKEMAVGLAPVLACLAFLSPDKDSTGLKLSQRFKEAWTFSRPLWFATAIYFVVRYLSLGTILGGYQGSVGEGQSAGFLLRWFDPDVWHRLFFPFATDLFPHGNSLEQGLSFAYIATAFLVLLRILTCSLPWRHTGFLLFWALTQAAPIYRLWALGLNLEGSRFLYFLSLSLSSFLPVLLLAPQPKLPREVANRIALVSLLPLVAVAFLLGHAAYATNLTWIHAGKEVRELFKQASCLSRENVADEKLLLLGLPRRNVSAHMILNGATLEMLLSPPFAEENCGAAFLHFGSILFGEENFIYGARFRDMVNKPGHRGPFVWSRADKRFVEIPLSPASRDETETKRFNLCSAQEAVASEPELEHVSPFVPGHGRFYWSRAGVTVKSPSANDGVMISNLHVNPLAYAFLKVSFRTPQYRIALPFVVGWSASQSRPHLPELDSNNFVQELVYPDKSSSAISTRTIYIPLSCNWHWYAQSEISSICLCLPEVQEISISELALVPAEEICPSIKFNAPLKSGGTVQSSNSGLFSYSPGLPVSFIARQGDQIEIQVSKRDFFFDNLKVGQDEAAVAVKWTVPGRSVDCALPLDKIDTDGLHQVRARSLDRNGQPVGCFSDPYCFTIKR